MFTWISIYNVTEARMNVFEFLMLHLIWGDQYIDGPMDPKIGGAGPPGPHGGCAYDNRNIHCYIIT